MLTAIFFADSWHHDHPWWPLWWLTWLLVVALLVILARRGWFGGRRSSAKAILAERYARGEIGADEYRERLDNL